VVQLTKRLRKDLADVRTLAELSRKRESRKLRQAQIVQEVLNQVVFTHEAGLRMAFENVVAFVHSLLTLAPQFKTAAGSTAKVFLRIPFQNLRFPTTSMSFSALCGGVPLMRSLIDTNIGISTHSGCALHDPSFSHPDWRMQADINLVIDNAMRYNKPGTPYYKAAQRIQSNSATLLAELDRLRTSASLEFIRYNEVADSLVQRNDLPIGDLEPPLAMLGLLTSLDIADELNIVLHSDPLQFLLAYELPETKPLPLAPVTPASLSRKSKRKRKVELAKKRAEQRAAMTAVLTTEVDSVIVDASIGSRAPTPTCLPAKSGAEADTDPRGTTSTVAAHNNVGLEDGLEAEQVLGKRKRAKPSSQPGTDAEVLTDINPKDSFALFDKGWILDPGVRRGGRARFERLPPPLPKKRPKGSCACRALFCVRKE
jgi:Bromodomain